MNFRSPWVVLSVGVVTSSCLNAASQAQLDSVGAVKVAPKLPALKVDQPLSLLSPAQPIRCDATTDAGTRFIDATEEWGIGSVGLNLTGNRLAVADLDSDGFPDLIVHAVSSNAAQLKDLPDGGKRLVWQLMNRPAPDGVHRVFVDETASGGFFEPRQPSTTRYRSAQLAVFGDVDNDGDLDAYSGTYVDPMHPETDPGDRSQILLNDGTGHFTLAGEGDTTPRANERLTTSSATFTDADRDGRLDVFVGHWYEAYGQSYLGMQAKLFKGLGGGFFADATDAANLTTDNDGFAAGTNHRPAYGVTSCDLDDDGAPELLVSAYGRQPNLLYRNDGSGHFANQSASSGFAGDQNVDFRDNQFFLCFCMARPTNAKCAGVSSPSLQCPNPADSNWGMGTDDLAWRNNGNTFTTWCGDLDGDGKNDLYNAEIHHWWAGGSSDSSELQKNVTSTPGTISLQRPGSSVTGLRFPHVGGSWNEGGLMAAGGDLDADGRMDLVVAASDYPDQFGLVFAQQPDGTFVDRALEWNLHHACMSGLAIADFDRDGDLDVIAGASTARDCALTWKKNEVRLYENQSVGTKWLLVHLEGDGTSTNRSAIGAKVTVKAGGHTWVREVQGGYGHFGMQNDLELHVGLAGCEGADVSVRWPNARNDVQTFERVPANTFVKLKQGDPTAYAITVR